VAAPTLTSSTGSDYTDNAAVSEVTGTLTWNDGDRILVVAMTEDQSFTLNVPTATGLTFSALGSAITVSNSCWLHAWSAIAAGSGSSAVTATRSGGTGVAMRGIYAFAYGGCTGFTRTNKTGVNSTEVVSVTRGQANSAVVGWAGDWSASGTSGIGWTPSGQTQLIAQTNTGATAVVAHWGDQGATGTADYGTTGLPGTAFTVAAVEVLGSADSSTTAPAENAAATATAGNPVAAVVANGEPAAATAVASDASVAVVALAEVATAAGAAYDATASTPGGGGTQSLFTSQTPAGSFSDGAPGIATATTLRFAQDGEVSDIAFYASSSVSGTYTAAFYSVDASDPGTGTLLGSATMGGAPTPDAWNTVPITPVAVTAGTPYRAVIFSGDGRYVATSSFFTSDLVNGDITADADGDTVGGFVIDQGTYRIDAALGYPNSNGGGTCYFVDVVFSTSSDVTAPAEAASAVATANDATASITFQAEAATAAASAPNPIVAVVALAGVASASAAANDVRASINAAPDAAVAAAEALFDPGSSISLTLIADAPVEAVGTAYDATAGVVAMAEVAAASAVAFQPAVQTSGSATAPAEVAAAVAAAYDTSVAVIAFAEVAAATAAAYSATVSTLAGTIALAQCAEAAASAYDAQAAVAAMPATATAAAVAADATARAGRAVIPRPYAGVVPRPYAGTVQRP
jgi:hypothetical protein